MTESGFSGLESVNWNGLFLPAQTPRAVVDRLNAAVHQVMQRPQVREQFARQGVPVTLSKTPEEFQGTAEFYRHRRPHRATEYLDAGTPPFQSRHARHQKATPPQSSGRR